MKYKILVLDADETLFDFKRAEKHALEQAFIDNKIPFDKNYLKIYSKINSDAWSDLEDGKITLEHLKTERFRRLGQRLSLELDANNFADCYEGHLAESSFLLDGALDFIKQLYGKFRLVILTNGIAEIQNRRFRYSPISQYFERIIISSDHNCAKPDKRIFDTALSIIGCEDKQSVLIIGDSLSSDIKGGNNAGIDTLWYNPQHKTNNTDSVPTYEASSYDEIINLLL